MRQWYEKGHWKRENAMKMRMVKPSSYSFYRKNHWWSSSNEKDWGKSCFGFPSQPFWSSTTWLLSRARESWVTSVCEAQSSSTVSIAWTSSREGRRHYMLSKCFWPITSLFIAHRDLGCGGPPLHLLDKIILGTAFKIPPDLMPASLSMALLPLPPPCSSHIRLLELSFECAIHPASFSFLPLSLCSCCFLYLECSSPFFSSFPFIRLDPGQIIPCSVNPSLTSLNNI